MGALQAYLSSPLYEVDINTVMVVDRVLVDRTRRYSEYCLLMFFFFFGGVFCFKKKVCYVF